MDEPQPSTELTFEDTPQRTPLWGATALVNYLGLLLVLLFQVALFSALCDHFFTLQTLATVANQIPDLTVIAVGMTLVLIIGGIDLSVGSVLALGAAVLGVAMVDWQFPLWAAALLCVGAGLVCGLVNGVVSVGWSSFIVTLGMLEAARGAAYLMTGSRTIYIGAPVEVVTDTAILGLSLPFVLAILIVAGGQLVLSRTVFGRYLIAIGTNEEAVRLSGIDPRPYKLSVFVLCGLLAALGAVIQSARMSSANPNTAIGFELQAIAAVVIGGTSLMGGRGSVVRSFFGVLIIAVLGTGLAQVGAQESTKRLITGCVIVAAVILDQYRYRARRTHNWPVKK